MSGHSKFSNIKHRKAAQDNKRSKSFLLILKRISVEAQKNNRSSNTNLNLWIKKARKLNIPKSKIEKALNPDKDLKPMVNCLYEGLGKNNFLFIISCLGDNINLINSEIKSSINKIGFTLGKQNSVLHNFKYLYFFEIDKKSITNDEYQTIICETDIMDFYISKNKYYFFYLHKNISNIEEYFKKNNFNIENSDSCYFPNFLNDYLYDENNLFCVKVKKFIEKIENLEYVEKIWTNLKFLWEN